MSLTTATKQCITIALANKAAADDVIAEFAATDGGLSALDAAANVSTAFAATATTTVIETKLKSLLISLQNAGIVTADS